MSDNTLDNLMTENTDMDNTTVTTEEQVTSLLEETFAPVEEQPTEETATEETVTEEATEEVVEEEVETEPAVETMEIEEVVTEEPTEEVATEEPAVEEMVEPTVEVVVTEEMVEEIPAIVEEQVAEDIVATEETVVEEETTEEVATAEEPTVEEVVEETPAAIEEQIAMEGIVATENVATEEVATETAVEETFAPVEGQVTIEEVAPEVALKKQPFKLTPPENNEELFEKMCVKRGRKLIYAPKEVIYDASFTVLGTNKKNEEGIRIKDILEAEIKVGTWLGYLDKYDGLKSSEIKEEYENDIIYEYAEQEFKKMGIIYDGKKLKVYVYDWDGKACHHVGYIDETAAADSIKYFSDKENYSFDLCGIITGGKGKRVTKNENGKITITKEKGGDYGIELDITVIARKD